MDGVEHLMSRMQWMLLSESSSNFKKMDLVNLCLLTKSYVRSEKRHKTMSKKIELPVVNDHEDKTRQNNVDDPEGGG